MARENRRAMMSERLYSCQLWGKLGAPKSMPAADHATGSFSLIIAAFPGHAAIGRTHGPHI
jgi:hypothetical protein